MASRHRGPLPFHVLCFAAAPVLGLWAANVDEGISWRDVFGPLGVVALGAVVVVVLATVILRGNVVRAGLATTVLVVLFFIYGPVSNAVSGWTGGPVPLGRRWVLFAVWAVIAAAAVWAVTRIPAGRTAGLTRALNVVAAGLLAFNVASVGVATARAHGDAIRATAASDPGAAGSGRGAPDIYYVVLDDYGGDQAMRHLLDFDNGPFLEALRRRGFYVVPRATTNYPRTELSLASSLNMQYVDALVDQRTGENSTPLRELIENDAVPRALKKRGYLYVNVGSWLGTTATNPQADINVTLGHGLSEFSNALLRGTALEPVVESFGTLDWDRQQYERVLFQYDQLAKTERLRGPKFVFGHILMPHWPYIVDADGRFDDHRIRPGARWDPVTRQSQIAQAYLEQLEFTSRKTLALIDALLDRPVASRPVIVLQSDEGFYTWLQSGSRATDRDLEQHFNILNAYYLPRVRRPGLYPTITPVNTFRLILRTYLGARMPLLADRNYVQVDKRDLYVFLDVTARVRRMI